MEAKIEKKGAEGKFKSWKMRCFRIKDRRLIHYNSSCNEWQDCIASKVKLDLDLAHMASASFYPKANPKPNFLHIKHPKIGSNKNRSDKASTDSGGLLLRFNTNQKPTQDIMCSWLKVLTAWGVNRKQNRIYVAIPSNFSYAMFNVLYALYDHPDLLTTEGIFRKESTAVRVKHELCNNLLYELISLSELQSKYNDIDLLAKSLQYLLSNLPSSIFGDHNFEDLLQEIATYDDIELVDNATAKTMRDTELDNDVAHMSYSNLYKLKRFVADMYLKDGKKYRHRYGLISLILHLLKQITCNPSVNRMSCHAMARLFSMCFESKQYMRNMLDPFRCLLLIKVLIYHAYFLFPVCKYRMGEIVVAEKQEAITMEKYKELKLSKKQKKNRLKKMSRDPPTNHFHADLYINNMDMNIPNYEEKKQLQEEIGPYQQKQKEKLRKLIRYQSHDDLDIGAYEKKEHEVSNLTFIKIDHTNHFEAIHSKRNRRQSISDQTEKYLTKHKSLDIYYENENENEKKAAMHAPIYNKTRSVSAPNIFDIPPLKSPSMSSIRGFARINQSKIAQFTQPCYLNNGVFGGEYIYFIGKNSGRILGMNGECFTYDLKYNTYQTLVRYPHDLNLNLNSICISMDTNAKRIFIVSGSCEFIQLMNINNNDDEYIWNDANVRIYVDNIENIESQTRYNISAYGSDVKSIFIESEICAELHIIGGDESNSHLRWDEHSEKMIKLYAFDEYFQTIKGHQLLYIANEWNRKFKSRLLLCGGIYNNSMAKISDEILYCNIGAQNNVNECEWDTYITLPKAMAYFGAIVYKNIFIVVFGGIAQYNEILNDIYYLNINTFEWKHCKIRIPYKSKGGWYAILTVENMIHLFQRDSNKHFTIKMSDIISDQILNVAEKQQENMYNNNQHLQNESSILEIKRQQEIYYKTTSTSINSITPTPNDYEIKQTEREIEIEEKTKQEKIFKNKKRKKGNKSSNNLNERMVTVEEINEERFTCKSMYDWCTALCGIGDTPSQPANIERVPSDSYQINDE